MEKKTREDTHRQQGNLISLKNWVEYADRWTHRDEYTDRPRKETGGYIDRQLGDVIILLLFLK
jgi:hypothetical protein